MVDAGLLRCKEREDKVYRLTVNGVEIQRLVEPHKDPANLIEIRQPCMGQGNAMANTCGPEGLAFLQRIKDTTCRQVTGQRKDFADLLEEGVSST